MVEEEALDPLVLDSWDRIRIVSCFKKRLPVSATMMREFFLILYYLQDLIVIKSNHIDFDNEDDQLILSDEYLNTFEQFVKKDYFDSLIKSPSFQFRVSYSS